MLKNFIYQRLKKVLQPYYVKEFQPIVNSFRAQQQRSNEREKEKDKLIELLRRDNAELRAEIIENKRTNVYSRYAFANKSLGVSDLATDAHNLACAGEDQELIKWTNDVREESLNLTNSILDDQLKKDVHEVAGADFCKLWDTPENE